VPLGVEKSADRDRDSDQLLAVFAPHRESDVGQGHWATPTGRE
jgi:hypothetical protein